MGGPSMSPIDPPQMRLSSRDAARRDARAASVRDRADAMPSIVVGGKNDTIGRVVLVVQYLALPCLALPLLSSPLLSSPLLPPNLGDALILIASRGLDGEHNDGIHCIAYLSGAERRREIIKSSVTPAELTIFSFHVFAPICFGGSRGWKACDFVHRNTIFEDVGLRFLSLGPPPHNAANHKIRIIPPPRPPPPLPPSSLTAATRSPSRRSPTLPDVPGVVRCTSPPPSFSHTGQPGKHVVDRQGIPPPAGL